MTFDRIAVYPVNTRIQRFLCDMRDNTQMIVCYYDLKSEYYEYIAYKKLCKWAK